MIFYNLVNSIYSSISFWTKIISIHTNRLVFVLHEADEIK
jgi:hypothetical protein